MEINEELFELFVEEFCPTENIIEECKYNCHKHWDKYKNKLTNELMLKKLYRKYRNKLKEHKNEIINLNSQVKKEKTFIKELGNKAKGLNIDMAIIDMAILDEYNDVCKDCKNYGCTKNKIKDLYNIKHEICEEYESETK